MEKKYKILIGFSILIVTGFLVYAVVIFIHLRNNNPLQEFQRVNENLERMNDSIDEVYGVQKLDENLIEALNSKDESILNQFYSIDSLSISIKDTMEVIKHWAINSVESNNFLEVDNFAYNGASRLKAKLENYFVEYNSLRKMIGLKDTLTNYFEVEQDDNGVVATWEEYNFFHTPLAAFVTNLSLLQSDVSNSRNEMVRALKIYSKK